MKIDVTNDLDKIIAGLAFMLESFDKDSKKHSRRTAEISLELGGSVGLNQDDLDTLKRAALIHDIGKIAVDESVLNKAASLTDVEMDGIRQHPKYGCNFSKQFGVPDDIRQIIYCHHEFYDGSGYPRGLQGDQIPFLARILTIADIFDALTSDRPNRAAYDVPIAVHIMNEKSERYDPILYKVFIGLQEAKVK